MCKETYYILQRMDMHKTETQLALQCAPLIAGLKISNLLIVQNKKSEEIEEILRETGISYFLLMETKKKTTLLLYKEYRLKDALSIDSVVAFFRKLGYEDFELAHLLAQFQKRYENYIMTGTNFPHEMGLLLGYPVEDVNGFIDNEGKNFLHSGYWKVYKDLPEKIHLFQRFDRAKKNVIQMIFNGRCIREVITTYREQELQQRAS